MDSFRPGSGHGYLKRAGISGEHVNAGHKKGSRHKQGSGDFIAGAIKHKGALTRKAKAAGESPMEFAREHEHDKGQTGRQARFAEELASFRKKGS